MFVVQVQWHDQERVCWEGETIDFSYSAHGVDILLGD